jgi:hypothetical protein
MFASMTFRLSETLRRAGAHLKAFALLQDPPPAPAAPAADGARTGAARAQHPDAAGAGRVRHQASATAASLAHRRPPRTRIAGRAARRPGSVPASLQPCITPVGARRGTRGSTGLRPPAAHESHRR